MTDYRKTPDIRPWSKDLDAGDILSTSQAMGITQRRLADFGLCLSKRNNGGIEVIALPKSRLRADRLPYLPSHAMYD
jgi:hypothetical protein